jgi:hypothetical protein
MNQITAIMSALDDPPRHAPVELVFQELTPERPHGRKED